MKPSSFPRRVPPRTRPSPGSMNKTEVAYAQALRFRQLAGEIVSYRFEALKLKLAANTFYTPDFVVTFPDRIECHEVKGFWRDDARVKIKVAAQMFPEFVFVAVRSEKGKWIYENF